MEMVDGLVNLTYQTKLKKSQPIYFAMDNITGGTGAPSAYDRKVANKIVDLMKKGGLNVVRSNVGPSSLHGNMKYMATHNIKNSILFNCMNGCDPDNIKEVSLNPAGVGGADGYTVTFRNNGNQPVLAWYLHAADAVHESGRGNIRGIYDPTSAGSHYRFYNPGEYMKKNKIIGICTSTDEHTRSPGDPEGERMVEEFLKMFEGSGDESEESTNSGLSEIETTTNGKTLSTVTTEEVYTKAWYQRLLTVKTNENGAFSVPVELKYNGKYNINFHFSGDKDYLPSTATTKIENYSGEYFTEQLLQKTVTRNYSDGTNEVTTEGDAGNAEHTKTVTKTQKYSNGAVSEETSTTIDNDKINNEFKSEDTTNSIGTPTSTTSVTSGDAKDPFSTVIAVNGDVPNVSMMKTGDKTYSMVDMTKTYTLLETQYREVFDRDSKSLQLNNYQDSKYTAFLTKETPNTYQVVKRGVWNAIEESIYYRLVKNDGKNGTLNSPPWPAEIKVDFANKKTYVIDEWINWKADECTYHFVADDQDLGYTCGPTSCSVVTQILHHYHSEWKMQSLIHAVSGTGSGPDTHAIKLRSVGFTAKLYGGINAAVEHLSKGMPCTWHRYNHYIALCDYNSEKNKILVANSALEPTDGSTGQYGPYTGWRDKQTVANTSYGQAVLVGLNWTISEEEKRKINNFYNSMGGSNGKKGNTDESIRLFKLGY